MLGQENSMVPWESFFKQKQMSSETGKSDPGMLVGGNINAGKTKTKFFSISIMIAALEKTQIRMGRN